MHKEEYSIYRVWYYPWFQACPGLGAGGTTVLADVSVTHTLCLPLQIHTLPLSPCSALGNGSPGAASCPGPPASVWSQPMGSPSKRQKGGTRDRSGHKFPDSVYHPLVQ